MTSPVPSTALPSGLRLPSENDDPKAAARAAARGFESLVARELLRAMRSTTEGDALAGGGFSSETLYAMFDDALADVVAGRLGVAPVLEAALVPKGTKRPAAPGTVAEVVDRARRVATPPMDAVAPAFGPMPASAAHPLATGVVTSPFGPRVHPVTGVPGFHAGLDVAAPEGTEIYAVRPGVVRFAGRHGSHGLMVEIEHDDGTRTRYAHASRIHVRRGDRVDAGEAVADVGATGRATGPHLHLEVLRNGRHVDPNAYLAELGVAPFAAPSPPAHRGDAP